MTASRQPPEPVLCIEPAGDRIVLHDEVTTIGRGHDVDIRLTDPTVSPLHAELVRRGPYVYVADLGLYGTRVNGRPVARRVLNAGDVLSFGAARCRIEGVPREDPPEAEVRRVPELTRRELDVLAALCRTAISADAFPAPATSREIAADLVVSEAAVKQHLVRLYQKFSIAPGPSRRTRLANEVVALGLVRVPAAEPVPSPHGTDDAEGVPPDTRHEHRKAARHGSSDPAKWTGAPSA